MNQTNVSICLSGWYEATRLKSHMVMLAVLSFVFLSGIQFLSAQTVEQLGEQRAADVYELIQSEMQFLENEASDDNYPAPAGVNTEYNPVLIDYYKQALGHFGNGLTLQDALLPKGLKKETLGSNSAPHSPLPSGADASTNLGFYRLSPAALHDLHDVVNSLDLLDQDDSDLQAIFDYWRTYKNQL